MRSMAVMAYDEPLALVDIPEPELRPGYSLLEVLTCGVCFSDLKTAIHQAGGVMTENPDSARRFCGS